MPLNNTMNRRQLLQQCGGGLGVIALNSMLQSQQASAAETSSNPLEAKKPHFPAKAKNVIWIFINGGPSHVDTWDYKPALAKYDGKPLEGFDKKTGFFPGAVGPLMKSPFEFQQHGECGKYVSEIFPHLSKHVDKMAFVHSGYTKSNNHSPALFMMNTGVTRMGFPCVGSWVTYGLGSENNSLPSFVVMSDPLNRGLPKGQAANWGAGFLPSIYQGTYFRPNGAPIDNLVRPSHMTTDQQRAQIDLLAQLNRVNLQNNQADRELEARIESFELAYRMQMSAPDALNIEAETKHTHELYGVDNKQCTHVAKQCLTARRMVERGVRFVQIYSGGMENQRSWDGHSDIQGNHRQFAGETDQPVAGLLADLEQRGLLDETLVIWGGEFGRLPVTQKSAKPGRDHNPHAFTFWFAGGGTKGGVSYGESDEIGHKAVTNRASVHDIHATVLHLLGLNHLDLTYRYSGRDFRLTDVEGNVIHKIIA